MHVIELQQVLPEVFAGNDRITSDVWHRQLAFQKGQKYLVVKLLRVPENLLCAVLFMDTGKTIRASCPLMEKISGTFPYPAG